MLEETLNILRDIPSDVLYRLAAVQQMRERERSDLHVVETLDSKEIEALQYEIEALKESEKAYAEELLTCQEQMMLVRQSNENILRDCTQARKTARDATLRLDVSRTEVVGLLRELRDSAEEASMRQRYERMLEETHNNAQE